MIRGVCDRARACCAVRMACSSCNALKGRTQWTASSRRRCGVELTERTRCVAAALASHRTLPEVEPAPALPQPEPTAETSSRARLIALSSTSAENIAIWDTRAATGGEGRVPESHRSRGYGTVGAWYWLMGGTTDIGVPVAPSARSPQRHLVCHRTCSAFPGARHRFGRCRRRKPASFE